MKPSLLNKLKRNNFTTGIVGLGYVGLELMTLISKKNLNLYGFEKNILKINKLKKKISPINTIDNKRLNKLNSNQIFDLKNINKISDCDVIIICLPTPLKKNLNPENSYLEKIIKLITKFLREEQMIIIESTVYPYATKEIFENKLSKKFNIGKNFYLGFSPERVSPGQHELTKYSNITKLVSGRTKKCIKNVDLFYKKIFKYVYKCQSIEIAEFTKLYENSYRAVNIGLANQMKRLCDKMNINIFDVIKAAETKPFGFKPFYPGPGVGGHCIPVDPLFLSYTAKKLNTNLDFILLARKVNLDITNWVIDKVKKGLKTRDRILLMGIAYKKNVDDTRHSPVVTMLDKLSKSYNVKYFDPFVENVKIKNKLFKSIKKLNYQELSKYSAVIITTNHDEFNYKKILKYSKKIFDTRGVYQGQKNKKIVFC